MTDNLLTADFGARRIDGLDLAGADLREIDLTGARLRGARLSDAVIDGEVRGLVINGVPIEPLLRAELDRRHPERVAMRSASASTLWDAATRVHELWDHTLERIRALPVDIRNQRVDDEWSALETLRHLIFIHDAWFRRCVMGLSAAFSPVGLAPTSVFNPRAMGLRDEPVTLAGLESIWADQYIELLAFLDEVSDDDLFVAGEPASTPGFPVDPTRYTRLEAIHTILSEQWQHRRFCERDLDLLIASVANVGGRPGPSVTARD